MMHSCGAFCSVVQVAPEEDIDVKVVIGEEAEGLVRQAAEVGKSTLRSLEVRVVLHSGTSVASSADAAKQEWREWKEMVTTGHHKTITALYSSDFQCEMANVGGIRAMSRKVTKWRKEV